MSRLNRHARNIRTPSNCLLSLTSSSCPSISQSLLPLTLTPISWMVLLVASLACREVPTLPLILFNLTLSGSTCCRLRNQCVTRRKQMHSCHSHEYLVRNVGGRMVFYICDKCNTGKIGLGMYIRTLNTLCSTRSQNPRMPDHPRPHYRSVCHPLPW